MSKIETLRHLPTPSDLRQSVLQIQRALDDSSYRLDATARQVRDLEQLPQLVAEQVSEALKALDPILSMRSDLLKVLEVYDQVTELQRSSLEAMVKELSSKAAQAMQQKTASLTTALKSVTENTTELFRGLEVSMNLMSEAVSEIQKLPAQLTIDLSSSVTSLKDQAMALGKAASALKVETDRARSRPRWKILGELLAVATVAALLVVVGLAGLNKLLPPTDAQIWAKAIDKEKVFLNQIVARPAK